MTSVFLIIGAPAVGKSTLSRALAARYENAIHVPVDDLREMVVSGMVNPGPDWSDDLVLQVKLAREAAVHMACTYNAAGFTVVIDDFYDPRHLVEYEASDNLSSRRLHKVLLYPSQRTAHQRNIQRSGGEAHIDEGIQIVYESL